LLLAVVVAQARPATPMETVTVAMERHHLFLAAA
jgi:hypothetical protein